ncbi:MAG: hypothetical protein E6767_01955 [Dysgonomonas sp.]|nr:hypothetical protein [Dysgonomonas sp.]
MHKVRIKLGIVSLLIIAISYCCTPYNSDKVNTELLQGKWVLTDVNDSVLDTINVDYTKELTFLLFSKDSCIQIMPDIKDTTFLSFNVHNYKLNFFSNNKQINQLQIDVLTKDSLVLSQYQNWHKYKRAE